MRVAALTDVGEIEIQERERPSPDPDEVLVEVGACSVCMTDFHMYHGTFPVDKPMVPGHESAGTVVEVGADVETAAVGDRVAVNPTVPCTVCSYCKEGDTHLCESSTSIGGAAETVRDGAFAEYVRVPEICIEDIGDMPFDRAALAEPLACCVHGVEVADITPGDSVAIIGAGPIGLLLLQSFRNAGAGPIVVSELDPERREVARELGADAVVDPTEVDPEAAIPAAAGGKVDVAAEAIGLVPTIEQANAVTANGGTTLIFGVPAQDATLEVSPFDIFYHEIDYRGSFALNTEDFQRAITMLRTGRVDADSVITDHIGLEDIPRAFERMDDAEGLKKIVDPSRT
ncbi:MULTISPECIES: alcohol dehydrogenase catalytic domain-containing protein [Haloarcula]|uniref:alcohol dehydrogenase catalytic domain-containing protein n=1 Tax=Haloarcula TaxID=2237 RepID=UPI0023EB5F5F|nr:alcohol dehydrogenase catalytic domain-containing protein [Halomicroarcula sp. XH51]